MHEAIFDEVVQALKRIINMTAMGNGLAPQVAMGPLQNRMQFDKVVAPVEQAKTHGAQVVCGGAPLEGPGHLYPLTLLTEVKTGRPSSTKSSLTRPCP